MSKRILVALCVLCPVSLPAFAAAAPVAAVAQDPAADKNPEIAKAIDKLKGHVEKKGMEDKEAVAVIDELNQKFKLSGPKDRASIVSALAKCFDARRDEKDGVANNGLFIGAAAALGEMGPESVKPLMQAIDHKNFKKEVAVRDRLIRSLGKTKDKGAVDTLVALLENKDNPIIGAAAEALGEYKDADQDIRKKAFEGLLKVLMSAKGATDGNLNDTIAREKYDTIASPIITALKGLSRQADLSAPEDLQRWWNKNKKGDWDKS